MSKPPRWLLMCKWLKQGPPVSQRICTKWERAFTLTLSAWPVSWLLSQKMTSKERQRRFWLSSSNRCRRQSKSILLYHYCKKSGSQKKPPCRWYLCRKHHPYELHRRKLFIQKATAPPGEDLRELTRAGLWKKQHWEVKAAGSRKVKGLCFGPS